MLHNSGAYGPNETPINANTPVNMSQGSAPLNINSNLQNLSDIAQQPLRGPSGHYNLPSYPAYGLDSLDMRAHLNSFSSHHLKSFHTDYSHGNPPSIPSMRWQNGMAPLNLNAQSTYVPSLQNYHTPYEKHQPNSTIVSSDMKNQNLHEDDNLITTEELVKASSSENYFYNTHQISYNHYHQNYESNSSILKDRLSLDMSKRKSLETTVKLIENILINTTKESQSNTNTIKEGESVNTIPEKCEKLEEIKVQTKSDAKQTIDNEIKDIAENYCTKIDENKETSSNTENQSLESKSKPTECIDDDKSEEIEPGQVLPKGLEPKIKIEVDVDPCQAIKEEYLSLNNDYQQHFLRDVNGTPRDNVSDDNLIISDNSVEEAMAVMKNVTVSSYYYECPNCGLLFKYIKRFLIHTKWHTFGLTNEKRLLEAREREMLKQARKEARLMDMAQKTVLKKTVVEEPKEFPCKDCPKIFVSRGSLKNHRTRFHSNRIRECPICGAVCMGWASMKAHEATHEASYKCDECGKMFRHKHSLARHAETHMGEEEKNLRCDICGKTFAVLARFREHQRCHARAERGAIYQCTYCAKSFTQSYSLTIHERTHRGEKPYTCTICNTSYGTNSSLKRHLKVSHNSSKPFECSLCGRCFSSERALNAHTVRLHSFEQTGDPLAPKKRKRNKNGPKKPKDLDKQIQKEQKRKDNNILKESENELEDMVT